MTSKLETPTTELGGSNAVLQASGAAVDQRETGFLDTTWMPAHHRVEKPGLYATCLCGYRRSRNVLAVSFIHTIQKLPEGISGFFSHVKYFSFFLRRIGVLRNKLL